MSNVKLHFFNLIKSKKTIVRLLLTILLLVVVVIVSHIICDIQINIHETEYNKLGNNLYYIDELVESKGRDHDSVMHHFQIISDYFAKNYDCSIFISNLNYHENDVYFNGYQLVNNVIIANTHFTITIRDELVSNIYFSNGYPFVNNDSINVEGLLSVDEVQEIAYGLTLENANTLLRYSINRVITGKIHLEYGKDKTLYYVISLNNGSYIKIDAQNGNVIDTFFFDGLIS